MLFVGGAAMCVSLPFTALYLSSLVDKYGSPLFSYSADKMYGSYNELKSAVGPHIELFYSLKANPNVSICKFLSLCGACFDVSSLAELQSVILAGVAPDRIIFT